VKFSEATAYGHNPLAVSPDRDGGGVRRQIQSFIAALNRTSRQLGTRQEAVLRALLTDLYAANGFYEDKPDSWRLDDGMARKYPKKYPTLLDAARFSAAKLRALYLGADAKRCRMEQVNAKARSIYARNKAMVRYGTLWAMLKPIISNRSRIGQTERSGDSGYAAAIQGIATGRELDDLIRYDSKDVLRSVVERLESLNAIGIFRPDEPPVRPQDSGVAL